MKSPFPGMDPYLERRWQDVHQRICTYASDQLNEQLGKGLVARLGERLVVQSVERARTIYPDVRVVKDRQRTGPGQGTAVIEGAAEPMMVRIDHDPEPQAFIEITEVDMGRLITVIEFLSASNKSNSAGRKQYKQKQKELHAAGVSLVEIDLLRAGRRVFVLPRAEFPEEADAPYFATIIRGRRPEIVELYPISIRDPLPSFRIPLRPSDPDVALRLQPLFEQAYRNGRYGETNYRRACVPPLEGDDAAWADKLLKAAGRR
jgi:hypothetical protein